MPCHVPARKVGITGRLLLYSAIVNLSILTLGQHQSIIKREMNRISAILRELEILSILLSSWSLQSVSLRQLIVGGGWNRWDFKFLP